MSLRRVLSVAAVLTVFAVPAHADNFRIATPGDQADFNSVAQDVTAALDDRAFDVSSSNGPLGFDVGGFASVTKVHDSGAWQRLTGNDVSNITVGGLDINKGLIGGLGVGAFLAGVSGTSATLYGADLRYHVLEGSAITPTLTLRGTYTGAANAGDFDFHSYGANATLSQTFLLFTPYAGLGYVWGKLSANSYGLQDANVKRVKGFAGLRLWLFHVVQATIEYQRLGHDNGYSARLSVGL